VRRPGTATTFWVVVVLVVVGGWFGGQTLTRLSGPEFTEAEQVGNTLVESCERRGPVTLTGGIGYWYACEARIRSRDVTIDTPGFFTADETGRTITYGWSKGSRGRAILSRPGWGHYGVLDAIGGILIVVSMIPVLFLLYGLWAVLRDRAKRLFSRR